MAFKAMKFAGAASEGSEPWDQARINIGPSFSAFRDASDRKWIDGYYRISESGANRIAAVKAAIAKGFPVVYGQEVDSSWENYDGTTVLQPSKTSIGGHSTFLYAYDAEHDVFLGQNSWGKDWGNGGRYKISPAAIGAATASDFWIVDHTPKEHS
jgi:C1A family cysteine protease